MRSLEVEKTDVIMPSFFLLIFSKLLFFVFGLTFANAVPVQTWLVCREKKKKIENTSI